MRIRTPVLIPLLMLMVATGTLIIGIAMGDTMKNSEDEGYSLPEAEVIHVTATLNIQLVDHETSEVVPNTKMYLKAFLEEHGTICGRYISEHNAVKITDGTGMVSITSGYDLTEGHAIRFQASHVSFRKGAHIVYFTYDEAEEVKENNSNAVTMSKNIVVDYFEDAFLSETFPRTPFGAGLQQQWY